MEHFFNIMINFCFIGMDSLMAVEIKQVLEREFDVFLTALQLRALTFSKLEEMSSSGVKPGATASSASANHNTHSEVLFRNLGVESLSHVTLLPINDVKPTRSSSNVIFIPG